MHLLIRPDINRQIIFVGFISGSCLAMANFGQFDAMEELVKYAMNKDIPYFAVNVPIDYCPDCGYEDEIAGDVCPKCGGKNIKRLRRVTGYITGDYKSAFNYGKQCEVKDRVKHIKG